MIIAAAAAGSVALTTAMLVAIKRLERRRAREVLARFEGVELLGVTSSANFFGRESWGLAQVRGNGVLVLTPEVLYFEMWTPRRIVEIPVSSMDGVSSPRSHLGKSKGFPLLKVSFTDEDGSPDSCAWLVRNPDKWLGALGRMAGEG